jgi:hypothetical protein
VFDDGAAEVGGVLDQRLAGRLTDQIEAFGRLVVLVELGQADGGGHRALVVHDQRGGRARRHALLALDAVAEAEHARLVVLQLEYVRRADADAGIAAGAAIVVDGVDQELAARVLETLRLAAVLQAGDRGGNRHAQERDADQGAEHHESNHAVALLQDECRLALL